MSPVEFRAWFAGFTEGKTELSARALAILRRAVAGIEDTPAICPRTGLDPTPRYWPLRTPDQPWWDRHNVWCEVPLESGG